MVRLLFDPAAPKDNTDSFLFACIMLGSCMGNYEVPGKFDCELLEKHLVNHGGK